MGEQACFGMSKTQIYSFQNSVGLILGNSENDTHCHKLPPQCQPIVCCMIPIYFAPKTEYH
jgi:hypothetical protein